MKTNNDYENLISILAVYSEAQNQLDELQAEIDQEHLQSVDDVRGKYVSLQDTIAKAKESMELLAQQNPQWFKEKKTIRTPYGEIKLADAPPSLIINNEEMTIALIRAEAKNKKGFDAELYIRQSEEPNKEALETLDDDTLDRFKVVRVRKTVFSCKPAKVNLGEAVAASAGGKEGK